MEPADHALALHDTHAHLDYPDFASDLDAVLARAHAAGVVRTVSVGTDLASSERAVALSERFPGVFAAVGWHPSDADKAPDDIRPRLRELARHPNVVAIGETGLDYFHLPSAKPGGTPDDDARHKACQARLFAQHLEVAMAAGLGCIVHQRSALSAVLAQMKSSGPRLRAVFHCFGESLSVAEDILEQGWLVSFTGILTFKNAQSVRDTAAALPLDRFMLETDCPFLAPVPHRGKRCEPAHVMETARAIAQARRCDLHTLGAATAATARAFFGRPGSGY